MPLFNRNEEDLPTEPNIDNIELGDKVRDIITGYEGVVSSRTEFLNGCVQVGIEKLTEEGKPTAFNFDTQQVEIVQKAYFVPPHRRTKKATAQKQEEKPRPGGPTRQAPRMGQ